MSGRLSGGVRSGVRKGVRNDRLVSGGVRPILDVSTLVIVRWRPKRPKKCPMMSGVSGSVRYADCTLDCTQLYTNQYLEYTLFIEFRSLVHISIALRFVTTKPPSCHHLQKLWVHVVIGPGDAELT